MKNETRFEGRIDFAVYRRLNSAIETMKSFVKDAFSNIKKKLDQIDSPQQSNQTFNLDSDSYTTIELIGLGGFGRVYKAVRNSRNSLVAVKEFDFHLGNQLELIEKEISSLRRCQENEFVVGYIDHKISPNQIVLVMQFCPVSLLEKVNEPNIHPISNKSIVCAFGQLMDVIYFMHTRMPIVIHHDLKIDNLLLSDSGMIKLCDFGSASSDVYTEATPGYVVHSCPSRTAFLDKMNCLTTKMYRAPELIHGFSTGPINEKSDVWSAGCILYTLCFGKTPFDGTSDMPIISNNLKYPNTCSSRDPFLIDVLKSIFVTDQAIRVSSKECLENIKKHCESLGFSYKLPIFSVGDQMDIPSTNRPRQFSNESEISVDQNHPNQANKIDGNKYNPVNYQHVLESAKSIALNLAKNIQTKGTALKSQISHTINNNLDSSQMSGSSSFNQLYPSNQSIFSSVNSDYNPSDSSDYGDDSSLKDIANLTKNLPEEEDFIRTPSESNGSKREIQRTDTSSFPFFLQNSDDQAPAVESQTEFDFFSMSNNPIGPLSQSQTSSQPFSNFVSVPACDNVHDSNQTFFTDSQNFQNLGTSSELFTNPGYFSTGTTSPSSVSFGVSQPTGFPTNSSSLSFETFTTGLEQNSFNRQDSSFQTHPTYSSFDREPSFASSSFNPQSDFNSFSQTCPPSYNEGGWGDSFTTATHQGHSSFNSFPSSSDTFQYSPTAGPSSVLLNARLPSSDNLKSNSKLNLNDMMGNMFPDNPDKSSKSLKELKQLKRADGEKNPDKKKVIQWYAGKERDIRSLLMTLHTALPVDITSWKPLKASDVENDENVKKFHRRALIILHPDKTRDSPHREIFDTIIDILNTAWKEFRSKSSYIVN